MEHYTAKSRVFVHPFVRQHDGEGIIIGRPDTATFLALPSDAIEILDCLADGKTVGEAQLHYQEKYSIIPDMGEFLSILEEEGFIRRLPTNTTNLPSDALLPPLEPRAREPSKVRFHFANFPQHLAQLFFCKPALAVYGAMIALAMAIIVIDPSIVPGWDAFLFRENIVLMRSILFLIGFVTLFLHEMAHLVAARAVGVSSRLGIGNRMWVLVAETDMTGVWSIPRNQRHLPFLAGPLLDCVAASVLIIFFFIIKQAHISVYPAALQIGRAVLFGYLLGLIWQCYFFVRTDFYYVIANFFGCKNLMGDTIIFLQNRLARVIRSISAIDQSHIPASEMRFIRWYSLIWLTGRTIALYVLFFIIIPLIYSYCLIIYSTINAGYKANPYAFVDAVSIGLVFLIFRGIGFWLWIHELLMGRR
jgi:putative peptide zinc metalloprotease protein